MTRAATTADRLDALRCIVVEDRCAPTILERIIREVEPFLKRAAAYIAKDFPAAVADMVQEARITLWQLDVGRLSQSDARYLERVLWTRMIDVYRAECRGGLTTGWSPHVKSRKRGVRHEGREMREAA